MVDVELPAGTEFARFFARSSHPVFSQAILGMGRPNDHRTLKVRASEYQRPPSVPARREGADGVVVGLERFARSGF